MSDDDIAQQIVRLLSRRAAHSSICPSEVARALQSDEAAWRSLMPQVRDVAAAMRERGRLRLTRAGADVPSDALHQGAIRLARGPEFDTWKEVDVINGSCLCGAVTWQFEGMPDGTTACNCTACRRYGVLWAHDYEDHGIKVAGPTTFYARGKALEFHFCPKCGCVAYWRARETGDDGCRRIAVNLRLSDPEAVAHIPIDHFDGLDTFDDLPRDGRCVKDYWF